MIDAIVEPFISLLTCITVCIYYVPIKLLKNLYAPPPPPIQTLSSFRPNHNEETHVYTDYEIVCPHSRPNRLFCDFSLRGGGG